MGGCKGWFINWSYHQDHGVLCVNSVPWGGEIYFTFSRLVVKNILAQPWGPRSRVICVEHTGTIILRYYLCLSDYFSRNASTTKSKCSSKSEQNMKPESARILRILSRIIEHFYDIISFLARNLLAHHVHARVPSPCRIENSESSLTRVCY